MKFKKGLNALPLHCHPKSEKLRKKLEARGETFAWLRGYHIRDYKGIGHVEANNKGEQTLRPLEAKKARFPNPFHLIFRLRFEN